MQSSLVSFSNSLESLLCVIHDSGGEISDEQAQKLDELLSSIASKIDAYKFVVDRLESEADWHKGVAKTHQAAAKACEATISRLKDRLLYVSEQQGLKEINGDSVRAVIIEGRESVDIADPSKVPASMLREKIVYEPNKEAILEAYRRGEALPSEIKIYKSKSVRFYASKPKELK